MTDHFAKEIFFLVVAITFIALILANFTVSIIESKPEAEALTQDLTFEEGWENTGTNFFALEEIAGVPVEFFTLFIMPLIILVGYIVLKTASGILPNWLSGG